MSDPQKKHIVLKVNEMTEVKAQVISLVKHAANRSPFKIFKSVTKEGNMEKNIDLSQLFKKGEGGEASVGVVTFMTKSEDAVALTDALKDKGITVVKQEDLDGASTLHLTDGDTTDTVIFKMSDDLAIGVTGIAKSFSSWHESESFVSTMATAGFFPGVRVATNVFMDTLDTIMYKAEAGNPPKEAVTKLTTDFAKYVKDLMAKVPVEAFKFEGMLLAKTESVVDKAEGDIIDDTPDPKLDAGGNPIVKTETKETDPQGNPVDTISKGDVETLITEGVTKATKVMADKFDASVKKNEDLFTGFTTAFESLKTSLAGVINIDPAGDTPVKKTEENVAKGDFDSALNFDGK